MEDELICDFAETYRIYDYRSLPLKTATAFFIGLRDNSRIKMSLREEERDTDTILLACIADRLTCLINMFSSDSCEKITESLVANILGIKEEGEYMTFGSHDDFKKAYEKITKGGN